MKLRQLREELGLTQAQLAQKTKCSQEQISLWENGKVVPFARTIKVLNKVLEDGIKRLNCSVLNKFDFGEGNQNS